MTRQRMKPDDRKEEILQAALDLAQEHGYQQVTRAQIAERAGVAVGLVGYYYGTMIQMRRAIMRAAIHRHNLVVLAQGLGLGDPNARKAPAELRAQAAGLLV